MNIVETNLNFTNLTKRNATNRIILHHTGVAVEQSIEVIHNYHKNSLGYAGIGYHFYVRKNGEIYRGRTEDTVGAHAYGSNNDSIGICFEGNFEEEQMKEAQIKSGKELVNYLREKYGINKVQMHRDVNQTSCPGANYPYQEIIDMLSNAQEEENTQDRKIKELQRLLNTVQDGYYGPVTQDLVNKRRIMNGAVNSNLVKFTQQLLKDKGYNLVVDGNFGSQTLGVVKQFQKDNSLLADGWVGAQTMEKLLK